MAPARTDQATAIDMYRHLAAIHDGPIIVQNTDEYAPLRGEQIAALVDEIPQIKYVKEVRQPGPKHIAEVANVVGDKVKCIFGGASGRFLPDEMRRGTNGNTSACELEDILVGITELWWQGQGQEEEARALHRRVLPLINLETHPFMHYILWQRGVINSLVGRTPTGALALDAEDKRRFLLCSKPSKEI